MTTPTINRVELTDAQRLEFQALLERNCSTMFDDLGDAISETCQEYAEALNSAGDDATTESFREELFEMVDYRCVVTGLNDWYLLPPSSGGLFPRVQQYITMTTTSPVLTENQLRNKLRELLLLNMDTSRLVDELIEAWSQDVNASLQERYDELVSWLINNH